MEWLIIIPALFALSLWGHSCCERSERWKRERLKCNRKELEMKRGC